MIISAAQRALLLAIDAGIRLMDHRDIDGVKMYLAHAPDGSAEAVSAADVHALADAGLISSNKKFPAATYWLTDAGRALLAAAPTGATSMTTE